MKSIEIGTDIIEIQRFRNKPFKENQSFYFKLFSERETQYCIKFKDPYPHFAGIFACKEAIKKCSKKRLTYRTIEITRKSNNKPVAYIRNNKNIISSVSISHTDSLATAIAFIL